MIKSPFTTNKYGYHYKVLGLEEVIEKLDMISEHVRSAAPIDKARVPYIIVQPFMKNTKEYKVACYAGQFQYIVSCASSHYKNKDTKAFSSKPHSRLKLFVEEAIACLRRNCPYAIAHGALRVDVFETDEEIIVPDYLLDDHKSYERFTKVDPTSGVSLAFMRKWVVNEFEGFEADMGGSAAHQMLNQGVQQSFMSYHVDEAFAQMLRYYA